MDNKKDVNDYKNMAASGMDLLFPVSIQGRDRMEDSGVIHHVTVKLFDPAKDDAKEIHRIAQNIDFVPPHPDDTTIHKDTIKGRNGNTMHVLKLKGPTADRIAGYHQEFKNVGNSMGHEFAPHITVDKKTWDSMPDGITAKEAGIKFSPAELKHGDKSLFTYHPKTQNLAPSKQKETYEMGKSADLEKGKLKNFINAAATAASIATTPIANAPMHQPTPYSRQRMLQAIEQVESSGGKNVAHKPTSHGTAYGKWALMPDTIKETIHMDPSLRHKYEKALHLKGDALRHYMEDNPGLDAQVADRHLARLEHHFGQDPEKLGFSWNQGITGTNRAIKDKSNIAEHPYTRKIMENYSKEK